MSSRNELDREQTFKYETILIEIIRYLINYAVELDHSRQIACNLVKESYDHINTLFISQRTFEHSKQIRDWIRFTPNNLLEYHIRIALEQVFGQKYAESIRIEIVR